MKIQRPMRLGLRLPAGNFRGRALRMSVPFSTFALPIMNETIVVKASDFHYGASEES